VPALAFDPVMPDDAAVEHAHQLLPRVNRYLASHRADETVSVVVNDQHGQEQLEIPRPALELFARVLAHMAAGRGVSIVPAHAELTTQQAADLLNVSRPFLIGLLEAGEIDFRLVGRHRRVLAESLYEYMRADDQRRRAAADDLSALTQEMGLD
jgi:excisionase family DNA binding protein